MHKKFLGLFLSLIMVITSSVTVFASENGSGNSLSTSKSLFEEAEIEITKNPSGLVDIVIVNADSNTDKEAFLASETKFFSSSKHSVSVGNESNLSPARASASLYDYQTKNVKSSYVYSKLDSDISYGVISDLRMDGSSKIYWAGSSPVNCDKIKMEDSFYISGVSVGFSFASGGKWTVSPSLVSSTATWSDSYNNKYTITHSYSNLDFNGYELYIKQTTTGYFTFSTTTYQLSAVDSTLL